jgi:hypothetical protein
MNQTAEHVIRNRDDLVDTLRSRKEQLGLSNAFVEAQLQMADGGCDKVLGPSQIKGMSILVMLDMIELFGARLVIQVNAETEAKMQGRWERRNERLTRPHRRFSKELLALARSQLFAELGKRGGARRAASLTAKQRSEIARSGAMARHRVVASASEGASP